MGHGRIWGLDESQHAGSNMEISSNARKFESNVECGMGAPEAMEEI